MALKLTVVARQMSQRFDQSVERTGLSRAKFGVIVVISRQPGTTQRIIAEKLKVSEVTAGRLIDRLCSDGYLERRPSPNDRRAHCVYLTPAAEPLLAQLSGLAALHEDEAFAGLAESELASLEALLDVIARNVETLRDRAAPEDDPVPSPAL